MEGTAIVRGTVTSAMQGLQLALSNDHKSTIQVSGGSAITGTAITIERRYYPGWAWAVCICLFPIGLLALFTNKHVDRGTIAVSDNGNGTVRLQMAGTFYKQSHGAINQFIEMNS